MDTGSTCTLLNEHVWDSVKAPENKLTPWIGDPLYLADGKSRMPLGWVEVETVQFGSSYCNIYMYVIGYLGNFIFSLVIMFSHRHPEL